MTTETHYPVLEDGCRAPRIARCTCGVAFDGATDSDFDAAYTEHVAAVRLRERVASAQAEAQFVADAIDAAPFATVSEIVATTVVYKRDGKTFHLVVHDMTGVDP